MDNCQKANDFVTEWLNHFNIGFERDVKINSSSVLDFYIPSMQLGILIVTWNRPISVQITNKAIHIKRELSLGQLFLISKEISEPAQKSLDRFGKDIHTIHPNGLSELAVSLASIVQSPMKMST